MLFSKENTDKPKRPPKDAATIILVRDSPRGAFEVFLMRRSGNQSFMADAFVFPGGGLAKEDTDEMILLRTGVINPAEAKNRLQEPDLPEEKALGLYLTAVRETFEEAGIMLAVRADDTPLPCSDPLVFARFAEYRQLLNNKQIKFGEILNRENLYLTLNQLLPYSHWITPEIESIRFDTRFFLARSPEGQLAAPDDMELVEGHWITPREALKRQKAGDMLLMPPTLLTLEEIEHFNDTQALFDWASERILTTILPQAFSLDDGFGVKLPHDPEYTIEGYKQTPRPGEKSRVILRNGLWRTV